MIHIIYSKMYRGIQLEVIFCCKNKKEASVMLDISNYHVNTYCYVSKSDGTIPLYSKMITFRILSGEMKYIKPDVQDKVFPYQEIIDLIDEHRLKFSTYNQTYDYYNKMPI